MTKQERQHHAQMTAIRLDRLCATSKELRAGRDALKARVAELEGVTERLLADRNYRRGRVAELEGALADLVEQLEGVGIAHKECDEGQCLRCRGTGWSGAEGLSFAKARKALEEGE